MPFVNVKHFLFKFFCKSYKKQVLITHSEQKYYHILFLRENIFSTCFFQDIRVFFCEIVPPAFSFLNSSFFPGGDLIREQFRNHVRSTQSKPKPRRWQSGRLGIITQIFEMRTR